MPAPIDRSEFEFPEDQLWLLHCGEGPVPRRCARALEAFLPRELMPWSFGWQEAFEQIPGRVKRAGGRVLGARPDDLTLTATTSSGLVAVAQGIDWRDGDEVLLPLGEFPSNVWPWLALRDRGVNVREEALWEGQRAGPAAWESSPPHADVNAEARLLHAIGPRTRVLSVSWVRFQDGLKLDLERLSSRCRDAGVHLVVDGIQGAGTLPIRLEGPAAFATGGHKGLLAPQGLGLLWTDPDFRRDLVPSGSWLSVDDATNFSRPSTDFQRDWVADGTRLEQGVPNLLGCTALAPSLELIADAGLPAIASHVDALQGELLRGLARQPAWAEEARRLEDLRTAGRLGSILSLHHQGRGVEFLEALAQEGTGRGIFASVREGYLRIGLHGWHDESDLERIDEWLSVA